MASDAESLLHSYSSRKDSKLKLYERGNKELSAKLILKKHDDIIMTLVNFQNLDGKMLLDVLNWVLNVHTLNLNLKKSEETSKIHID